MNKEMYLELGKLIFQKGAPILGAVIAGQPNDAFGALVQLLGKSFDIVIDYSVSPKSGEELTQKLSNCINNDPEAATKLQKIQTDNTSVLLSLASNAAIAIMRKIS